MDGWLPVAHMRHHITGVNQCPGCKCTDETIDHFLQCPHPTIVDQQRTVLAQLKTKGIALKIPKDVLNAVTQTLSTHMGIGQGIDYKYYPGITTALEHQQQFGIHMMARGFLTKQWQYTIHPKRHPTRVMVKLQCLIWMEFIEPLWANINALLHHTVSLYNQEDDDKLTTIIN